MEHQITFIRCAATLSAQEGRFVGLRDEPVSEQERNSLLIRPVDPVIPDRIYSGGFRRCRETAELLYPGREIHILSEMLPYDYGDFSGRTYSEICKNTDFLHWSRSLSLDEPMPGASVHPLSMPSPRILNKRIFHTIMQNAADYEMSSIVIVAHGSFIRHVMQSIAVPRNWYHCIDLPRGRSISVIYDGNEEIACFKK